MYNFINIAHAQLKKIPCPDGMRCPGAGEVLGATTGVTAVNGLISSVIGWLLGIAFALTVLFLVIGGIRYIISGGNEESADKAKKTIMHAIIGIVIVILSYIILNVLVNTISGTNLSGNNFSP